MIFMVRSLRPKRASTFCSCLVFGIRMGLDVQSNGFWSIWSGQSSFDHVLVSNFKVMLGSRPMGIPKKQPICSSAAVACAMCRTSFA